jgi:cobalamin biosynthesis Mg chelatase CobN
MPQTLRERVSIAVAASLGQRSSTCGEHERARVDRIAVRDLDDERVTTASDVSHATSCLQRYAHAPRLGQQRVQHRPRTIAVGKQLAVFLLVQRHTELTEELHRVVCGKRAQHVSDDPVRAAPEVLLRDHAVSDIASPTAAHENLCARLARTVETHDAQTGRMARAKDRRGEPCGSRTDDSDVSCFDAHIHLRQRSRSC